MASGAARRKRKRENEKRAAWDRVLDDDETAQKKRGIAAETAEAAAAAAMMRRKEHDLMALNASTSRKRDDERDDDDDDDGGMLSDAVRIPVRARRDSPHVLHVMTSRTTFDAACVFFAGFPARWGRREIEHVVNALGFGLESHEKISLSTVPALSACVVRLADDGAASGGKKSAPSKSAIADVFLSRAAKLTDEEPVQGPTMTTTAVLGETISLDDESAGSGLNDWVASHRRARPGIEAVKSRIDSWFERKEDEERAAEAEAANATAGDGWTVVQTKRGRKKTTDEATGTTVGGIRASTADGRRKTAKKIAGEEFYRHQSKEKKRTEIMELQAKFEQDKLRIARLKAARKFRPL
jgi:ribosomal RNA-processing protein 7